MLLRDGNRRRRVACADMSIIFVHLVRELSLTVNYGEPSVHKLCHCARNRRWDCADDGPLLEFCGRAALSYDTSHCHYRYDT